MAISSYVNGSYTFVSMRTGAGKIICYWISAILREGLTIIISPLVSLIDDQVIETIAAGIGYAKSFVGNESFTRMLLNFAKYASISFVIDEMHCIIECKHFRESWSKLRKISTLFPNSPIMMLTGTCKESDAHQILENLCLATNNVVLEIIKLLEELRKEKCIIYCPTIRTCDNVYEKLHGKSDLELMMAVYYSSLDNKEKKKIKIMEREYMIVINAFEMGLNNKKFGW
ncbi:P-loop containing nucleoside triphosphate hydrolase protein [Rhizophagus diaphanus]|nr:P-loop containing nucleoside triphosphate hydrolase protein [Rhizophagus diaphanus] [Rhizophagus sp. MUCL 43196]